MTDEEIKTCIKNSVSEIEYRSWNSWYNKRTDGSIPSNIKEKNKWV
jgi:hypothetical protein